MSKITEEDYVEGYMCKTDFDYELDNACGGNVIYPSLNNLQQHKKCWSSCGVVKVKVYLEEVVVEENYDFSEQ